MLLEGAMKARLNIIISGGTGSGKTTLLNTLSSFIPERRPHRHDRRRGRTCSSSRSTSCGWKRARRTSKARAQITATDLVRNALRMRPDRIIIGECRGPETLDMLQAMNTGHEGSLTTLPRQHAARRHRPSRNDDHDGRLRDADQGHAAADRQRRGPDRAGQPPARRPAQGHQHHRGRRHGAGHDRHARHFQVRRRKASTNGAGPSATSRPPASARRSWTAWNRAACGCPSSAFRERTMLED